MAMPPIHGIRPPAPVNLDSNPADSWRLFRQKWQNYATITQLQMQPAEYQVALFLHTIGDAALQIYNGFTFDTDDDSRSVDDILAKFDNFAVGEINECYERLVFHNRNQQQNEPFEQFLTSIRVLVKSCNFCDACRSSTLRDRIILGVIDRDVQETLLKERNISLERTIDICRAAENAKSQSKAIRPAEVNKIDKSRNVERRNNAPWRRNQQRQHDPHNPQANSPGCHYCGGKHQSYETCPAKGQTCNFCLKPNHFEKVCRRKKQADRQVRQIDEDARNSSEEEYAWAICNSPKNKAARKSPMTAILINNINAKMMIDTGASVNVMDEATYDKIYRPTLMRHRGPRIMPYGGGTSLDVLGVCDVTLESKSSIQCHRFDVIKGAHGSLIGFTAAQELGLVNIVNKISSDWEKEHPGLTKGIGKLKDVQVKLHIDESVRPVAITNRKIPFHMRPKIDDEEQRLLREDTIEKVPVGEPTPWVSPIVTPPKKDGSIRLCIDMREPNKAIMRERHNMPTLDELIHDLNGATVFSKLDLSSGYHQLELHPSSRYITTFRTHNGLYRYKRLNFGISSASEIFQEHIRKVISHIAPTKNISDDIIIYGKGENAQAMHDRALAETLDALHTNGLTLNLDKCKVNMTSIEYYGMIFSKTGVSPDPKKVQALKELPPPSNVATLRSFLGMMNYLSRFIKDFSIVSEPLRRLTKKDADWVWAFEQDAAFSSLKNLLVEDACAAYFDVKKATSLIVDASPTGLGSILIQDDRAIAFASRSLSDVESRYSQTEREALGVVWACEHFNQYLQGDPLFTIITDHEPLLCIWKKSRPPLRIERWGLRLQPYNYVMKYMPGSKNPTDYMSRNPTNISGTHRHQKMAEQYVNFIAPSSIPRAMKIEDVKQATENDDMMQRVIALCRNGRWFQIQKTDVAMMREYYNVRDELTVTDDNILLRGKNVVIPASLINQVVALAHEGHQGIVKTKELLRSKVWFPQMNDIAESAVRRCFACQCTQNSKPHLEPMQMSDMPGGAWRNLSMDFLGPLPSGEELMVLVDEYSRFPIVEIIRSVSANTVIPVLDKHLATFGYPDVIKSDNGAPFNSDAFASFAKHSGFRHRRVTECWPRGNAQAEGFNKPLMKAIRSAVVEQRNWKQEMYQFLRQYRATPHTSTKFSPHRLLFGREPGTKLPCVSTEDNHDNRAVHAAARENDKQAKQCQKTYADKRNKAEHNNLHVGDMVLMRNDKRSNKLSSAFSHKPMFVTDIRGTAVTAVDDNHSIRRNTSRFKKVLEPLPFCKEMGGG